MTPQSDCNRRQLKRAATRFADGLLAPKARFAGHLQGDRLRLRQTDSEMQGQARIAAEVGMTLFDQSPNIGRQPNDDLGTLTPLYVSTPSDVEEATATSQQLAG
jgi:hypothetical protein